MKLLYLLSLKQFVVCQTFKAANCLTHYLIGELNGKIIHFGHSEGSCHAVVHMVRYLWCAEVEASVVYIGNVRQASP